MTESEALEPLVRAIRGARLTEDERTALCEAVARMREFYRLAVQEAKDPPPKEPGKPDNVAALP